MTALLRYLSGYVCVELTGYATERFLNLCTNHDINLWNMDHKEDTYTFCMSLEDFRKIQSDGKENKDKDTDYKEMRMAIFFVPLSEKKDVFIRTSALCRHCLCFFVLCLEY